MITVLLASLLLSCHLSNPKILTLCTNITPFLAYIEYINSLQNSFKIQVKYVDNPADWLQNSFLLPDLVLFEQLAAPEFLPAFEPLTELLTEKKINPESIYPPLLANGLYKSKQVLLPLAFSLPMIQFSKNKTDKDIASLLIHLDFLKSRSLTFEPGNSKKKGFFPFWNEDFIYTTAVAMGAGFSITGNNQLQWNEAAVNNTIVFFKNWKTETAEGYEAERLFLSRYMQIPAYKLIEDEKISYYFSTSETIYEIPQEKQKNLDFRWFAYNQKIPVCDNITYVGIPKKATHKKVAMQFLDLLFKPQLQAKLLEINNFKRITAVFGIANKFSSIIEVNKKYLPQFTPLMVSHIPEADFLLFPGQLPGDWKKKDKNIIKSWLVESIQMQKNPKKLENLLNF